jgi:hypothetical protein
MPVAQCRNCGTVLVGRWCHDCGQDARSRLLDVRTLAAEYLDAAFNWDSKLVRTLRTLYSAPGELTLDYWAGRQARWVTPLRLYLVVSFVFFLLLALVGAPLEKLTRIGDAPSVDLQAFERSLRHLPLLMFLFVPVFAALLQLAFAARDRLYAEQLIFALHYHALAFSTQTLGLLVTLVVIASDAPMALALLVVASVAVHAANAAYLLFSLKRVYGHGWPATLARAAALGLGYTSLLGLTFTLIFEPRALGL